MKIPPEFELEALLKKGSDFPPPKRPRTRKCDLYSGPNHFRHVDDHVQKVSFKMITPRCKEIIHEYIILKEYFSLNIYIEIQSHGRVYIASYKRNVLQNTQIIFFFNQ